MRPSGASAIHRFGRVLAAAMVCAAALVTFLGASPAADAAELPPVKLFFVAEDRDHGRELWRSDGTEAGTRMVLDILPGSGSSEPRSLLQLGGWLLFTADDGEHGRELWRTDGTAAGTGMVTNLSVGQDKVDLYEDDIALGPNVGSYVYFRARDHYGRELWRTDGTPEGTSMVRDIRAGPKGSMEDTDGMAALNGIVYFGANDGTTGRVMWRSDGTYSGTFRVGDAAEWGPQVGSASPPEVAGDTLYFQGRGSTGVELWASDGTAQGTRRVKEIRGGPHGSFPYYMTEAYGRLYFVARQGSLADGNIPDHYLWHTDGTKEGTVRLHKGLQYPWDYGGTRPVPMLKAVYFNTEEGLYRTEGSHDTTTLVRPFPAPPSSLANVDLTLYFGGSEDCAVIVVDGCQHALATGQELWRSDGTDDGTTRVADINPVGSSSPGDITDAAGTPFFFAATTEEHGRELWRSDGTAEGTYLVRDIDSTSTCGAVRRAVTGLQRWCEEHVTGYGSDPYYLTRFDRP